MSSILDALKKAEQNATITDDHAVSWPAPTAGFAFRRQRRSWMRTAGAAIFLLVLGGALSYFFFFQGKTGPLAIDPSISDPVSPPVAEIPSPVAKTRPTRPAIPKPAPASAFPHAPAPASPPPSAPASVDPLRESAPTPAPSSPPRASATEDTSVFKNDPRIDLQALVWDSDAAGRFVIINNRLIKQGGSVSPGIIVERINPDDVLLVENGLRWRQSFQLR